MRRLRPPAARRPTSRPGFARRKARTSSAGAADEQDAAGGVRRGMRARSSEVRGATEPVKAVARLRRALRVLGRAPTRSRPGEGSPAIAEIGSGATSSTTRPAPAVTGLERARRGRLAIRRRRDQYARCPTRVRAWSSAPTCRSSTPCARDRGARERMHVFGVKDGPSTTCTRGRTGALPRRSYRRGELRADIASGRVKVRASERR